MRMDAVLMGKAALPTEFEMQVAPSAGAQEKVTLGAPLHEGESK